MRFRLAGVRAWARNPALGCRVGDEVSKLAGLESALQSADAEPERPAPPPQKGGAGVSPGESRCADCKADVFGE